MKEGFVSVTRFSPSCYIVIDWKLTVKFKTNVSLFLTAAGPYTGCNCFSQIVARVAVEMGGFGVCAPAGMQHMCRVRVSQGNFDK